jgi:hypothetical protein
MLLEDGKVIYKPFPLDVKLNLLKKYCLNTY